MGSKNILEQVESIEKYFLERKLNKSQGYMCLLGYPNFEEINSIKVELEKRGYECNLSHETYVEKGVWPYRMDIWKNQAKQNI